MFILEVIIVDTIVIEFFVIKAYIINDLKANILIDINTLKL